MQDVWGLVMAQSEETIFSNNFGSITTKRVIYYRKKGWFSGRFREDVPLKQIASIQYDVSRNIFWGIVFLLIGLSCFGSSDSALFGIIFLAVSILILWGSPAVMIVTTGGTTSPSIGYPWEKKEAEAFVSSLRNQIFSD